MGEMAKIGAASFCCRPFQRAFAAGWPIAGLLRGNAHSGAQDFRGFGRGGSWALPRGSVVSSGTLSLVFLSWPAFVRAEQLEFLGDHPGLAGPRQPGRWTGIQNFFGNLAGAVVPAVTGFLLDRTAALLPVR